MMMGGRISVAKISVLGFALALTAVPASGQQFASVEIDPARAAQLEAEAEELMADQADWKKAEKLLREAAALRPAGDALAVKDLLAAAKLMYYGGRERSAMRQLEDVGQRALTEGNVLTAAHAFADAAWIAKDNGHGTKALELADRAQRLANSPLIDESERQELLERFTGAPAITS
jgi:hypothetical protein